MTVSSPRNREGREGVVSIAGFFIVLLVVLVGVAIAFDLRAGRPYSSGARMRRGDDWTIGNMGP